MCLTKTPNYQTSLKYVISESYYQPDNLNLVSSLTH